MKSMRKCSNLIRRWSLAGRGTGTGSAKETNSWLHSTATMPSFIQMLTNHSKAALT